MTVRKRQAASYKASETNLKRNGHEKGKIRPFSSRSTHLALPVIQVSSDSSKLTGSSLLLFKRVDSLAALQALLPFLAFTAPEVRDLENILPERRERAYLALLATVDGALDSERVDHAPFPA